MKRILTFEFEHYAQNDKHNSDEQWRSINQYQTDDIVWYVGSFRWKTPKCYALFHSLIIRNCYTVKEKALKEELNIIINIIPT